VNRGEVYWATLAPRSGSEQGGRRPVVIVSNDVFNANPRWRSVIVVPLSTSQSQARRGPTAVLITRNTVGLNQDSVALCHQITTLDRAKLETFIGALSADQVAAVENGVMEAVEITRP